MHAPPASRRPPGQPSASLAGKRILVVEDEFFVALLIEEVVHGLGGKTAGPVPDVKSALELAQREELDGAVLDVNLNGHMAFPVADALADRGIPFVFVTGYGPSDLPERMRDYPRVTKPFDSKLLRQVLQKTLAGD